MSSGVQADAHRRPCSQAADNAFNDAREIGAIYEALEPEQAERALRFWKLRKQAAAAA